MTAVVGTDEHVCGGAGREGLERLIGHVDDSMAVRPDGATRLPEVDRGIRCGSADLLLVPGVSAVVRGRDEQRFGRIADELRVADIDVAEERTGRGVVGPDLLLVS